MTEIDSRLKRHGYEQRPLWLDRVLAVTVVFPNFKIVSSASFQPLTLPVLLFDLVRTGRFRATAGRLVMSFALATSFALAVTQRFDLNSAIFAVLFLSGPLTALYLIGFDWSRVKLVVEFGLFLLLVSALEQALIGSATIESIWATFFAIRPDNVALSVRGLPGFHSEPSQSGRLFATLLTIAAAGRFPRWRLWLATSPLFLFLNRSGFAFLLIVPLLVTVVWRRSRFLAVAVLLGGLLASQIVPDAEIRFLEVIPRALAGLTSDEDIVLRLGEAGGRRTIETFVSADAILSQPSGYGLGASETELREVALGLGYNLELWPWYRVNQESGRPSSYVTQLFFDLGLVALLPTWTFIRQLRRNYNPVTDPILKFALVSSVAQILFFSTTTIPWPWVLIAMVVSGGAYGQPDRYSTESAGLTNRRQGPEGLRLREVDA